MQISTNNYNYNLQSIHFEELTLRCTQHRKGNKSTGAEKEMEMPYHEATQPISGDILHQ